MSAPNVPDAPCCMGNGSGGHHPMCEHRPKGTEVRGVVARNGYGDLCFFATAESDGFPILDKDGSFRCTPDELRRALYAAPPRRVLHATLRSLDPDGS
jgi:hypothetical protein